MSLLLNKTQNSPSKEISAVKCFLHWTVLFHSIQVNSSPPQGLESGKNTGSKMFKIIHFLFAFVASCFGYIGVSTWGVVQGSGPRTWAVTSRGIVQNRWVVYFWGEE